MPGGVNSANLFAMLDEGDSDDDSAPVQKQAAPAKPAAKKEEPKKADVAKNKGGGKGDRREPRGGNKRDNHDSGAYDGSDKPTKPADKEGRGKGRERRDGEKGERKGKGKGSRGREFDRHVSGTGRGKGEVAREGRGRGNWGEKTDDAPADDAEGQEGENKPRRERAPRTEEVPQEPEEEEEPTMTFEEYMKSKEEVHVGPVLEERKVTAEDSGFQYSRGGIDSGVDCLFNDNYDGKHADHEKKGAREGTVNADKLFNMKFVDPNAGGKGDDRRSKGKGGSGKSGGKGAQGGGKGARQTSQSRPQQQGGKSLELDDANAFPSLA